MARIERSLLIAVLRNLGALIIGLAVCMAVNYGLVMLLGGLFPPPPGVDPEDINSIRANMHKYSVLQMLMPFIAHAIGTLAGALVAALIASNRKMLWALIIGVIHMAGGIMMVRMLPEAPLWFKVLDLGLAYIPMAYLGAILGGANRT